MCIASVASVRSGKAVADWITASATYETGKPVQTAVRLVVDEGWHTYWENPGAGGMKISATWELPAGWVAGGLEHPVPKRFTTDDLVGFGYEGTVVFPVKFTPPTGFTGVAKLRGKISWLTCNDDQCVPGDAELKLSLDPGPPRATAETPLTRDALAKIPRLQEKWVHLGVAEKKDVVVLRIEAHVSRPLNLEDYEIFPATPQVVDPSAKILFIRNGSEWTAEVTKSEYLVKPAKELTLVLVGRSGQPPMALTWKSE